MEYPDAFLKKNEWLRTLNAEELNDELNRMSSDELFALMSYYIQQHLGEEFMLSEEEEKAQIERLLQMTLEPETESSPENKH